MSAPKDNTTMALIGSAVLVGAAALADDPVTPFYSITFGVGSLAAYYLAISSGPLPSLLVGTAVVTAMILQGIVHGGDNLIVIALQAPAMIVFFVGLGCLPGILPNLLEAEEKAILAESSELEDKLKELETSIADERRDRIEDRGNEDKEEMIRVTSRTTQLTAFLREVLQASSTKEIYSLLFTNVTKSFGAQEVALLTLLEGGEEAIISKAAHPEYALLEGKRISLEKAPLLRSASEKSVPVLLPERVVFFEPDLGARLLLPLRLDGRCEALISLGRTRNDRPIETEDAHFLGGLAELAGYAAEQLTVVLNS